MAIAQQHISVLVCAELVGRGGLARSDGFGSLMAIKTHIAAIEPLFAEEGGRVVNKVGTGLLLEFSGAFEAVAASLRAQRRMAERDANVAPDNRLALRIGIHLGDAAERDNVTELIETAVRLQEIAAPGGICISQAVQTTIHKNIDALFRTGGAQVIKSGAAPMIVYNLATAIAGPHLSLVVLPFVSLSEGARQEYLVDSVTEHLTNELARIDRSFVVDRGTALAYRGDALDVTTLGATLGVRYVVKGSVRDAADGLRVNAELIDATTGDHLWVDRFEIAVREPLTMQRDILARLIPPLHGHLLAAEGRAPQPPLPPLLLSEGTEGFNAALVMHPRGASMAANVRVPPATQHSPETILPTAPRHALPHQRKMYWLRLLIKVVVVLTTGVLAFALLGAQRGAIIEVCAWMLLAAGLVQVVSAIYDAPPEG